MVIKKIQHNTEKGQSLMELSFSLMILLLLIAGVVDLGRAFFTFVALRDAAQEGAVFGSMCPVLQSRIIDRAKGVSNKPIDFANDPNVAIEVKYVRDGIEEAGWPAEPSPGDDLKVKVVYKNFMITMPFIGAVLGNQSLTLRAEARDTILTKAGKNCPN